MFPGYTYPVILDLPYDHWLLLAFAYDDHLEYLKSRKNRKR